MSVQPGTLEQIGEPLEVGAEGERRIEGRRLARSPGRFRDHVAMAGGTVH
jgi:hypothetical protein